jgi:hypothetical protein
MPKVHRMFFHYSELPLSQRMLFAATLVVMGIGYLFAMIQIYEVDAGRDGRSGLSAEDIAIAYSGNKAATRLEAALLGPMSGMLPAEERVAIVQWVQGGLDPAVYDRTLKPIFTTRCIMCHDGKNPQLPTLGSYENIAQIARIDRGMSLATLVRVSHIHMFSITFIFFIMGMIFSHAYVRPVWFKSVVIVLPFVSVVVDIGSWYLTKLHTGFAWAVIVGGALMGFSFAVQWVVSMYQIFFYDYVAAHHPEAKVG